MSRETAILVKNLGKTYRLYDRHSDRVKEVFHPFRKAYHQIFHALEDVSFEVQRGTTMGIIGRNGSGKSTLLQIICGILKPTAGTCLVDGRISALLELGAGFNPEFTGRENVYLNAAILGIKHREIETHMDEIIRFADIGDFVDQPVKTYSSGMYVRLAFAISISIEPDILVVDEALSVGDIYYQHKCMHRMKLLMNKGTTILFVSHDTAAVKSLCRKAILLERGRIVAMGGAEEVVNRYYRQMVEMEPKEDSSDGGVSRGSDADPTSYEKPGNPVSFERDPSFQDRAWDSRFGSGDVRVQSAFLLDERRTKVDQFSLGQRITVCVHLEFFIDCHRTNVGFIVRDRNGVDVLGTNLFVEKVQVPPKRRGEYLVVDYHFQNILRPGSYSIALGVGESDDEGRYNLKTFDWVDNAVVFRVIPQGDRYIHTMVSVPIDIDLMDATNG